MTKPTSNSMNTDLKVLETKLDTLILGVKEIKENFATNDDLALLREQLAPVKKFYDTITNVTVLAIAGALLGLVIISRIGQ